MTLSAAGAGYAKFDTKKAHKKANRIGAIPASMARGWISLFVSFFVSKSAVAVRRAPTSRRRAAQYSASSQQLEASRAFRH
jgi:hypothetical protein